MPASAADLLRFRLIAHGLEGPAETTPEGVVDRMLAVQAQDFGAACWALGIRAPGVTQVDVLAALDAGRVVRSWPMRGTLHFVPPHDLGWMLQVTTERMVNGLALRHRQLELEETDFAKARDLVTDALVGGRSIGRTDLMELWTANGVATSGQRGYHLIYYLAQTGVLCWGPTHKTQQSLVLLDEWVPDPRRLEPDEALAEFFIGYVRGHGPATVKDFVWWTKGTVAGAKTGIAVAGDRLTSLRVDDTEYWMTAESAGTDVDAHAIPRRTAREKSAVHLLPAFDEYFIGYQNRDLTIDPEDFDKVVPGGNGVFAPVLVSQGRVIGTWKRSQTTKRVTVEPRPFTGLSASQRTRIEQGAASYGRFVGLPGVLL
jgi:hypothetical protein